MVECRVSLFGMTIMIWGGIPIPEPPKVGRIIAQNLQKAIILHTCKVQVTVPRTLSD